VTKRLDGRIALVTGASRGLGAAVAKRYAAEGAQVIALARGLKGLEQTDDAIRSLGGSATLVPLDLRHFDQLDQMAAALHQRFGRIDILASCAATLGHLAPIGHVEPGLWQEIVETNLTAPWRLIRALDPLLRLSSAGRAIFATCEAAHDGTAFWGAYGASKAALEAMVRSYAAEMVKSTVRVNLIDPGPLRTELRFAAFPFEDRALLRPPDDATEAFVELAEANDTRNGERIAL
jgi:NAD(P)-dependent dehydrogenase (short-subunit alcohol dehydrogenase family)